MDKKKIRSVIFVTTLVLVLTGFIIDMGWVKINIRFFNQYNKLFAPVGYFIYVGYDWLTNKK